MSTASQVANADWNIIAGAVATFIITAIVTWRGLRKGKKTVESGRSELTPIVGATLMESTTMLLLSEALKECTDELRANTAELKRCNDINLLTHRK